jgi:hypothetical protein
MSYTMSNSYETFANLLGSYFHQDYEILACVLWAADKR